MTTNQTETTLRELAATLKKGTLAGKVPALLAAADIVAKYYKVESENASIETELNMWRDGEIIRDEDRKERDNLAAENARLINAGDKLEADLIATLAQRDRHWKRNGQFRAAMEKIKTESYAGCHEDCLSCGEVNEIASHILSNVGRQRPLPAGENPENQKQPSGG